MSLKSIFEPQMSKCVYGLVFRLCRSFSSEECSFKTHKKGNILHVTVPLMEFFLTDTSLKITDQYYFFSKSILLYPRIAKVDICTCFFFQNYDAGEKGWRDILGKN